ncbi:MAG: HIT domain-containing protein [Patescibacteria group bacterium]
MKKCVYCTRSEIRARTIIKNKLAFAFPTYIPITPGHTLICPIRCVATVDKLTRNELLAIFDLVKKLNPALSEAFNTDGFNYAWNEGDSAGQDVPHYHLHMVPRKKGDTGIYEYEPRKFLYRPGSREKTPEDELKKIVERIRKFL